MRVEDFLEERTSWNAFWDYVSELLREPSSHLVSALDGDKYIPEASERAMWNIFELWLSSQSGRRKPLKRPWTGKRPDYREARSLVTPQREQRRARLAEMF